MTDYLSKAELEALRRWPTCASICTWWCASPKWITPRLAWPTMAWASLGSTGRLESWPCDGYTRVRSSARVWPTSWKVLNMLSCSAGAVSIRLMPAAFRISGSGSGPVPERTIGQERLEVTAHLSQQLHLRGLERQALADQLRRILGEIIEVAAGLLVGVTLPAVRCIGGRAGTPYFVALADVIARVAQQQRICGDCRVPAVVIKVPTRRRLVILRVCPALIECGQSGADS